MARARPAPRPDKRTRVIAAPQQLGSFDEALHTGLRFRLDDMKERLSRLDQRAAKKRQLALDAMTEVGFSKLEQPDFTASTRAGSPVLVVIAEDNIPEIYWLPQPPKLDRRPPRSEGRSHSLCVT
jgi:hypothetical protein